MIRIWLSGIAISVAAHLAVAGVLLLALELQPAERQPEPGTRLNVSAIDVAQIRAVPRPLPVEGVAPLPAGGQAAAPRSPAPRPAPERKAPVHPVAEAAPAARSVAGRSGAGVPVVAGVPGAANAVARVPERATRLAAAAQARRSAADAPPSRALPAREVVQPQAGPLTVAGLARIARSAPAEPAAGRSAAGRRLAGRPPAAVPAAGSTLPLARIAADTLVSKAILAGVPQRRSVGARRPDPRTRLAMIPAGTMSDAHQPPSVALEGRAPRGGRADPVLPDGRELPSLPPAAAQAPERLVSHAPVPPAGLAPRAARSRPVPATALRPGGLPQRAPSPLPEPRLGRLAAAPPGQALPADFLWSGTAAPEPGSLAALGALTGATGTDALVARAEIERVLTEQPCSRVRARLDAAGSRVILSGHVPDQRAAVALMAALRGPLGRDVGLAAALAMLPRPLCEHVERNAALGLQPARTDRPEGVLGPSVQAAVALGGGDGRQFLRLTEGTAGFVHVDLYDAAGGVTHLQPPPGALPVRRASGDAVPLDIPDRSGRGPAVLAILVTSQPLYLQPRAGQEGAVDYLRFLENRAEAERRADGLTGSWRYAILPSVPDGE